jgi:hypothetical protein
MSLVNDVLRQLDAHSAKPYQAMPLHSLMIEQPSQKNKWLRIAFILLVGCLFFIIMLQIFYKQPLVDIFNFNDFDRAEIPQQSLVSLQSTRVSNVSTDGMADKESGSNSNDTTTPPRLLITEDKIEVINRRLIANKNDRIAITDDLSRNDTVKKEVLIPVSEVKGIEIKNTDIKNNQEKKLAFNENNHQSANITAVENTGFKHYQLSLRAYKNKKTSVALSWIDLALAAGKKDEYLKLKVRILMQKGDRAELHRFVLAQNDHTSLGWFQLIAPSLQMYAYYELSNKYYSELIKQQPNDVKWQLAMALNYSKLDQIEKTYSIYKALLNSSLLTYKQQKWIAKRLGRIEQGKVAINER